MVYIKHVLNIYCKNKEDGRMLNPDDTRIINEDGYSYGIGMLLVSDGNKICIINMKRTMIRHML